MTFIASGPDKNTIAPLGGPAKRLGPVKNATENNDVPNLKQVNDLIQTGITTDILDNNNAWTGNNTHTGTESFTNAAGITTDTITPATSGAGTSYLRPAGIKTTTPIAATALKSGGVYGLSKADGIAITLPVAATATIGTTFRFHIITSCTSVGYVISTGAAGNVMIGGLWCTIANPDAANDMEFNIATSTNNTLTLGATTACGLAGGYVDFTLISTTQWAVSGTVLGSGTLASNLFTTV